MVVEPFAIPFVRQCGEVGSYHLTHIPSSRTEDGRNWTASQWEIFIFPRYPYGLETMWATELPRRYDSLCPCGFVGSIPSSLIPSVPASCRAQARTATNALNVPMFPLTHLPTAPPSHIPTNKFFVAGLRTVRNKRFKRVKFVRAHELKGGNKGRTPKFGHKKTSLQAG